MSIIENWWLVLKHAWSVRLLIIAALLSGGAVALPILEPIVPRAWLVIYAMIVFMVIVAAMVARFVAQRRLGAD